MIHDHYGWPDRALRAVLAFDGAVILSAALLNFGARIPIGGRHAALPGRYLASGTRRDRHRLTLLAVAFTARRRLAWLAFGLSVFGILFGLSSRQLVGPARGVHLLLVPLALAVGGLLLRHAGGSPGGWRSERRPSPSWRHSTV